MSVQTREIEAVGAPRPRKDPRPRVAYEDAGEVLNKDPERTYVLVYRPTVERYLQIGWEIERVSDTGPRMRGVTANDGEPIEFSGHVLMSMSKADKADLERYGHKDGGAPSGNGQEHANLMEKRMRIQSEVRDRVRGINRGAQEQYFRVINTVTGEELTEGGGGTDGD